MLLLTATLLPLPLQVTALNRATQRTETFTGRYLLSTLPLGVLKASYSSIFTASMDSAAAARQGAIDKLGMGLLNKVSGQLLLLLLLMQAVVSLLCHCAFRGGDVEWGCLNSTQRCRGNSSTCSSTCAWASLLVTLPGMAANMTLLHSHVSEQHNTADGMHQ
jgi:hypothetical protein